jgi:dTDP-glucose 4,6-dehydratase
MTEMLMSRRYLERWIQIGTSELYGSVTHPAKEDDRILPSSPYAASNAAADMHLISIANVLDFPMNILRPSNAYAPGQLLHRVIPRAVVAGLTGQKIPLYGGGQAQKSYIHARDLGRAIWLTAEKAPMGRIYNVGPKEPISIRDLMIKTSAALGIDFEDLVEDSPPRLGEDSVYWLDSSRIDEELGWRPEISLEDGLAEMVEWGRKYLDILADWPTDYVLKA